MGLKITKKVANKFQFQISKPISHLPIYKWNCFWHFKAFITCPFSMVIIIMAFWAMNWENVISNPDFTVIWLQVRCTYSRSFNLHPDFWKSRSIFNPRKFSVPSFRVRSPPWKKLSLCYKPEKNQVIKNLIVFSVWFLKSRNQGVR